MYRTFVSAALLCFVMCYWRTSNWPMELVYKNFFKLTSAIASLSLKVLSQLLYHLWQVSFFPCLYQCPLVLTGGMTGTYGVNIRHGSMFVRGLVKMRYWEMSFQQNDQFFFPQQKLLFHQTSRQGESCSDQEVHTGASITLMSRSHIKISAADHSGHHAGQQHLEFLLAHINQRGVKISSSHIIQPYVNIACCQPPLIWNRSKIGWLTIFSVLSEFIDKDWQLSRSNQRK